METPKASPRGSDLDPAESFIGDRSYDWVAPADVVGGEHPELPPNVRAFVKRFQAPEDADESWINIYRVKRLPGAVKARNAFLERISAEDPPDEAWLKARYGGGEYVLHLEWRKGKKEQGLRTAPILVDDWEPGQAPSAVPPAAVAAAPAVSRGFDPMEMEARMWDRMERLMTMMSKANPGPTPSASAIIEDAQRSANRILEETAKQAGLMLKEARMLALDISNPEEVEPEEVPAAPAAPSDPLSFVPEFIRPYFPMIEAGFRKLLSGNAADTAMVRGALTTSEDFQKVLGDQTAVAGLTHALSLIHGEDKVNRAWEVLNAPPEEKPTIRTRMAAAKGKAAAKVAAKMKPKAKGKRA